MQVNNNLSRQNQDKVIAYTAGNNDVKLSPNIVRQYLVSGNGAVTDQEVTFFIHLCKGQGLNPFLKEAYLIKYGDRQPATMVVSKEAFMRRAEKNEAYDGNEAGVIVLDQQGNVLYRRGTFYNKNTEQLLGGWAEVYKKGISHPIYIDVNIDEYMGKKNDGTPNSTWASKPSTMIRKVALVQALREAFPNDLNQMYTEEEMNVSVPLDTTPIEQPDIRQIPQQEPQAIPQSIQQQTQIPQDQYYQQAEPQFVQSKHQQDVMMERPSFV